MIKARALGPSLMLEKFSSTGQTENGIVSAPYKGTIGFGVSKNQDMLLM